MNQPQRLIKALRRKLARPGKKRCSRAVLARALGCAEGSIFNWETGVCRPVGEKHRALMAFAKKQKLGPKKLK